MAVICAGCRVYGFGPHECQKAVMPTLDENGKPSAAIAIPCDCAVDPTCAKASLHVGAKVPGVTY